MNGQGENRNPGHRPQQRADGHDDNEITSHDCGVSHTRQTATSFRQPALLTRFRHGGVEALCTAGETYGLLSSSRRYPGGAVTPMVVGLECPKVNHEWA